MVPTWLRKTISHMERYMGLDLMSRDIPTFPKGFYIGEGKTLVHVTPEMYTTPPATPEPEPPKKKTKQQKPVKQEPPVSPDDDMF